VHDLARRPGSDGIQFSPLCTGCVPVESQGWRLKWRAIDRWRALCAALGAPDLTWVMFRKHQYEKHVEGLASDEGGKDRLELELGC